MKAASFKKQDENLSSKKQRSTQIIWFGDFRRCTNLYTYTMYILLSENDPLLVTPVGPLSQTPHRVLLVTHQSLYLYLLYYVIICVASTAGAHTISLYRLHGPDTRTHTHTYARTQCKARHRIYP